MIIAKNNIYKCESQYHIAVLFFINNTKQTFDWIIYHKTVGQGLRAEYPALLWATLGNIWEGNCSGGRKILLLELSPFPFPYVLYITLCDSDRTKTSRILEIISSKFEPTLVSAADTVQPAFCTALMGFGPSMNILENLKSTVGFSFYYPWAISEGNPHLDVGKWKNTAANPVLSALDFMEQSNSEKLSKITVVHLAHERTQHGCPLLRDPVPS